MITVTVPVSTPTGLQSTLLDGGSLEAETTYYFIVIAYDYNVYSPNSTYQNYHSAISEESSFVTTATKKSVKINWINSAGATRYQILVTKVSGDYTGSAGYGTAEETLGSITSGVTGYTITATKGSFGSRECGEWGQSG
jgi:hypothetical protein